MRRQLRRQKFDCLIQYAATEGEYLKALREFSPDLILSDYKFPLHSGLFSLKMAHELCPAVPFIFVSGVLEDDLAGELLKQGARAYVSKSRLVQLVNGPIRVAGGECPNATDTPDVERSLEQQSPGAIVISRNIQVLKEQTFGS